MPEPVTQTWTSMQWRDWTPWIEERCRQLTAKRVLEIGGVGRELAGFVRQSGAELTVLNSPVDDICRPTPLPGGSFDLVLTKMGLEHFYDPARAAAEITRLLAPGGILIVATVWAWRYHTAPGIEDYWRFSPVGLRQLFPRLRVRESGFDLTDRRKDCRLDAVPVDEWGGWREHWYSFAVAEKPRLEIPDTEVCGLTFDLKWLEAEPELVKATIAELRAAPRMQARLAALRSVRTAGAGNPARNDDEVTLGCSLFAAAAFCRGAAVLVAGSESGVGAYVVAEYAASVVALSPPTDMATARNPYPSDNRIEWMQEDRGELPAGAGGRFDVALTLGLNTDAETPVRQLAAAVRLGGIVVGSMHLSPTGADTYDGARKSAVLALLLRYFSRARIMDDGLVIALR